MNSPENKVATNSAGIVADARSKTEAELQQDRAERERREKVVADELANIESRLGIPAGFIQSLFSESSDWEFIVKLSVLIEAAVTRSIVTKLGNPAVFDHFSVGAD